MKAEGTTRSSPSQRFCQLFALSGFAVAQPLFDILGRYGELLLAHDVAAAGLFVLTAALSFGIPFGLTVFAAAARLVHPRLGDIAHEAFATILAAAFWLLVLRRVSGLPGIATCVAAGVVGVVTAAGLRRAPLARFTNLVAGLCLILPAAFLLTAPIRGLWLPGNGGSNDFPAAAVTHPIPVVVLVFDQLRLTSLLTPELGIDGRRYPHLAALAGDSWWFRRATTVTNGTAEAIPALLTGRYPREPILPTFENHPGNLFTLLGESHQLSVNESLTQLCPPDLCQEPTSTEPVIHRVRSLGRDLGVVYLHLLLPSELADGLPLVTSSWRGFGGDLEPRDVLPEMGFFAERRFEVKSRVVDFLASLGLSSARPTLHYFHLEIPHSPFRFLPSGIEYGPITHFPISPGIDQETIWTEDEWLITLGLQRHLLQVGYADRVLGEIIDTMKTEGLYDKALLVVTADHGIAFVGGEPLNKTSPGTFAEMMSIPLFLRIPDRPETHGMVSDRGVEIIDILPTIGDLLGIENLPWPVDGQSVLDGDGRETKLLKLGGMPAVAFPAESFLAPQLAAIQRIVQTFGDDSGIPGLFGIGPSPQLHGQLVSKLEQLTPGDLSVALVHPWIFEHVEADGPFLPSLVEGFLVGYAPGDGHHRLAIAVNNIIRATTRSFTRGRQEYFSVMVPEESFAKGKNIVEVFLISQEDPAGRIGSQATKLLPLPDRSGPRYRLVHGSDGEVTTIEASNDSRARLIKGVVEGEVIVQGSILSGWVVDREGGEGHLVVMAFVDGSLLDVTTNGWPPPEWAPSAAGPSSGRSGFRLRLPESLVADGQLQVFGIVGDRGSEIPVRQLR